MSKGYDKFDDAAAPAPASAVVEVELAAEPERRLSKLSFGGRKSEVNGNQFDNPLHAAAAASTPETTEEDWQWSEEPRNAHNYRQDFGKRISAAGKARKGAVEGY